MAGLGLQPEYVGLLGFPLGAAIAAKAIVTSKVAEAKLLKTPPPAGTRGFLTGLGEIVTDDQGQADLLDLQYFMFNLVALAYFLAAFLPHPERGLPVIPASMLALGGVSTISYGFAKALDNSVPPQITSVTPTRVRLAPGTRIVVEGSGFAGPRGTPTDSNAVLLDGIKLAAERSAWSASRVTATLPQPGPGLDLQSLGFRALTGADAVDLVVHDDAGQPSAPIRVQTFEV